MRMEVPGRGDAAPRRAADASEAAIAGALGALPGLPPAARAAQRAVLEALAGELLPTPTHGAAGLPRWLLLLVAAALLLAVARFGPDDGGAHRPSSTPAGDAAGESAPALGAGRPTDGHPGLASLPPAVASPSPAVATVAESAAAAGVRAGAAFGTVVVATGRDSETPDAPRPVVGTAPAPGPASTSPIASARAGGADGTPSAIVPVPPTRAANATPCRQEALPPVPAGGGPWIVGRIQDEGCRPLAEVLLAFTTVTGETEFLARSEADGSYAVALDPGTYRTALLVDRPWWAARGQLDAAGTVTRSAADVPLRVDFVVGGGER